MIKKMKKILIIPLLLFCVIQIVYGEDWFRYASDHQKSFIYDSDFSGNFATGDITESSLAPEKISDYSPLVADLDGDGLREIIIVNNNEIRLFRGTDYTLVDTWYNIDLTPLGQMEVVDFITGGNKELMVIVDKGNGTESVWAINWNGNDFIKSRDTDDALQSNGLNCEDIDDDAKIECIFVADNGWLYAWDKDGVPTTIVYGGDTDICPDCSIPVLIDYDDDGDDDIFVVWGSNGKQVKKFRNNGGSSFTLMHTWSLTNPVSQFAMIDLDGGQKELVIAHTTPTVVYLGCGSCSILAVYGIIDNNLKCSYSNFDKFHSSPSNYASAGFIGLRTCYGQGGDCDGGGDAYDDIWLVTSYTYGIGEEIMVFNWDGTPSSTCTLLSSNALGVNIPVSAGTGTYPRGVWANLDSDSDYEFLWGGWIFDKDGSLVRQYYTDSDMATPQTSQTYFVVAEVTGDATNDIIYQNGGTEDEIHVYSIHEEGCYDSDDGLTFLTEGYIINGSGTYWDYCVDDILTEYYCFFDEAFTWDKDCTDYGAGYECSEGKCQLSDCSNPDGSPTQYYCTSGYVYYCNDGWQNYKICGLSGSNETGNCVTPEEVNDTAEGICEPAVCHDTDGINYLYKGNVNYNDTSYYDFCVGDGVVEKICNNSVVSELLKDCKDYGSEYGCVDGACSLSLVNCTDSDGTDFFNKGYVADDTHDPIVNYDFCISNTTLQEYFCSSDGLDVIERDCRFFGSLYKCYDGACVIQSTNCTDSDDVDFFTKGYVTDVIEEVDYWDFCYDLVTVSEFICSEEEVDTVYYQCSGAGRPYYCSDGRCISIANCTDTDGGIDYFTKGHTYFIGDCPIYSSLCDEWDVCADDDDLVEYYCAGNATITGEEITCPLGCYDGACIGDEELSEEDCFTDSGISVCLIQRTSYPLCVFCDCYSISNNKCPIIVNGTEVDTYEAVLFNWDECEDWKGSVFYGACPLYIWSISLLDRIWNWIFGAFWIFLTLILVIIIVLLIVKKVTNK